ncbi:MAG: diguanylate cyclase [Mycobacteriales bacterium]
MPLRVRLAITLAAIVLVPLLVTALFVRGGVRQVLDSKVRDQLRQSGQSVAALVEQYRARSFAQAVALGNDPRMQVAIQRRDSAAASALSRDLREGRFVDFVGVTDARGAAITTAGRTPEFTPGAHAPTLAQVIADSTPPSVAVNRFTLRTPVVMRDASGHRLGAVVTGFWLDNTTLGALHETQPDVSLTLEVARRPIATTLPDVPRATVLTRATLGEDERVDGLLAARRELVGGPLLVSATSPLSASATLQSAQGKVIAILLAFMLLAAVVGWLLSRVTTRPLAELSDAAIDVANGRLDTHIEVRSKDEIGQLALAFNTMTDELRTYIQALQDSRDELKRNLMRLGDTLSSTHDLKRMLAVILETAMVTIRAEAGSVMLFTANQDELYLKVGRGLDGRLPGGTARIAVGDGVAGAVAANGEAIHGCVGDAPDELRLAPGEPNADSIVSVPLKSQGRVIGVLNLYDRVDADEFEDADVATIRSFANQATVAVDNVLLHQEAQRLSITDGLTGLWNYRFFQLRFDSEIERASRFGRPLALLILDLDKFKAVNDAHGHQRGDAVLVELAARIKGAIREVDILARYGGEEFVLVLPETDLDGAQQTAAKVTEVVRQRRFGSADEEPLRITISIGVAVYPDHGRSAEALVRSADVALYDAKRAGRDRYAVAATGADTSRSAANGRGEPGVATEDLRALGSVLGADAEERDTDLDGRTGDGVTDVEAAAASG